MVAPLATSPLYGLSQYLPNWNLVRPSKTGTESDNVSVWLDSEIKWALTRLPLSKNRSIDRSDGDRILPSGNAQAIRGKSVRSERDATLPGLEKDDLLAEDLSQNGNGAIPALRERHDRDLTDLRVDVAEVFSAAKQGANDP